MSRETRSPSDTAAAAQFLSTETVVADVFRRELMRDIATARLSAMMRVYYQLRPWVPLAVRQYLQGRKRKDTPHRWCFPDDFLSSLTAAVGSVSAGIPVIHPWPDGAQWAFVLTHDVETAAGLSHAVRLTEIESEFGFRSSWNIVPYAYPIDMGVMAELRARGCEIGVHGYNHDGRLFSSRRVFERRAVAINDALARYEAVGFRAPMVHRNLDWLQQLDVAYDASCFDKDPFQAMSGGVGGVWPFLAGRFVELPYTLPQDHTLLVVLGETDDRVWRLKLDWLVRQHGMALMLTHPDYLTTARHLDLYREFLRHVHDTSGFWHALPQQVAAWWRVRQESRLQKDDSGGWHIEGPAAERAGAARLEATEQGIAFTRQSRVLS
jgi:peptidoglycan/xylan/chitin deacetylase (PgdA/CDA1 family)